MRMAVADHLISEPAQLSAYRAVMFAPDGAVAAVATASSRTSCGISSDENSRTDRRVRISSENE
jgi:hypothetical protein